MYWWSEIKNKVLSKLESVYKQLILQTKKPVPAFVPFDNYFPTIKGMTIEQIRFYNYFKAEITNKRKVEIYGNKSYAYLLACEYIDRLRQKGLSGIEEAINCLSVLNNFYEYLSLNSWIGDIYLFDGKFEKALEMYKINPKNTQTHEANKVLNIKNELNLSINAPEILCTAKRITKFGQDNFDKMVEVVNLILNEEKIAMGEDYLKHISSKYKSEKIYGMSLFNGYMGGGYVLDQKFGSLTKDIKTYCFYAIPEFYEYCLDVSRKAENLIREEMNLPKVGEGWISETELYYKIKNYYLKNKVVQHASPSWLGRQHLDIFIEDLNIAIEYHGKQHFEPVEFFGGQKAFVENQKRDNMKREKCKMNNIQLIELKEGYSFDDVIQIIENIKKSN